MDSLLPKINKLGDVSKRKKAVGIVISESKPDRGVLDPEIHSKNYKILHSNKN